MNRSNILREKISDNEIVLISSYPNIFYYSGFSSEDAVVVISKNRQILFTDSRYTIQAKNEAADYEISDISKMKDVIKSMSEEYMCFEEDVISVKEFSSFQNYSKKLKPYSEEIKKPRRIKDEYEISKIKEAQRLCDDAFLYILGRIKEGVTEIEIASELEYFIRKNGAQKMSFDTICASGIRSAMPHAVASDKIIKNGDFVTLDFGCVLDGYCSDMTRTIVVKNANDKQKEIYQIVKNAQENALKNIKAGLVSRVCDAFARDVINDGGYKNYFGHSTGHSVGIEIHELPGLSPKSDEILQEGNVVSVEPGIYIENFGGVRIEDLVQITSENIINLTNSGKELLII